MKIQCFNSESFSSNFPFSQKGALTDVLYIYIYISSAIDLDFSVTLPRFESRLESRIRSKHVVLIQH